MGIENNNIPKEVNPDMLLTHLDQVVQEKLMEVVENIDLCEHVFGDLNEEQINTCNNLLLQGLNTGIQKLTA